MSQPAANVSLAPLRPHQQRTQQYLAFSPHSANAIPFAPFGRDMSPGEGGHSGHVNVDEDADIDVDVDADVDTDVEVDVDIVDAGLANLRRQNERSRADDDLAMSGTGGELDGVGIVGMGVGENGEMDIVGVGHGQMGVEEEGG